MMLLGLNPLCGLGRAWLAGCAVCGFNTCGVGMPLIHDATRVEPALRVGGTYKSTPTGLYSSSNGRIGLFRSTLKGLNAVFCDGWDIVAKASKNNYSPK